MSRRSRARQRALTVKAAPRGIPEGTVAVPVASLLAALTGQSQRAIEGIVMPEPMPRPAAWGAVPFAPGSPLVPQPINQPEPGGTRPAPRRFDYPVSVNLPGVEVRLTPWKVLRDAADQVDLMRRCIEVRKAEVRGLGWDIAISDRAVEMAREADPAKGDAEVTRDLRQTLSGDIARLREWWTTPDRTNGLDFNAWVGQVIEEHLVLDAVAIYPRCTYGGDLFALEVLDGSTIKPLLDERGNTPAVPFPAYQQVLMGFPRGEFTADVIEVAAGIGEVPAGLLRDQLIYERWNVRTFTPYGFSAVEMALDSADLWLKRRGWLRAEYTDGVMPSGWMETDTNATPEQLRAYNAVFNDYLSGNTRERQRIQTLPKGFKPVTQADTDEKYRADYDEFVLKLVCSHFGVLPSTIGFTPKGGLGGKGHQEGEEDSEERLSTRPVTEWLAGVFTRISRTYLGMPAELEFKFIVDDADDGEKADEAADRRFKSGRMTLNETRDQIGQPRFDFPEADQPMVVTASGVIFLEGEAERQTAQAEQAQAASEALAAGGGSGAGGFGAGAAGKPKASAGATAAGKPAQGGSGAKAKADEETALRKFASKGNRSRSFVCQHLTGPDDLTSGLLLPHDGVQIVWKGDAPREALAGLGDARRPDRPAHAGRGSGFEWFAQ